MFDLKLLWEVIVFIADVSCTLLTSYAFYRIYTNKSIPSLVETIVNNRCLVLAVIAATSMSCLLDTLEHFTNLHKLIGGG